MEIIEICGGANTKKCKKKLAANKLMNRFGRVATAYLLTSLLTTCGSTHVNSKQQSGEQLNRAEQIYKSLSEGKLPKLSANIYTPAAIVVRTERAIVNYFTAAYKY
jgi:hypothetical protein